MTLHMARKVIREIFLFAKKLGPDWICVSVHREGDDLKCEFIKKS